MAEINTTGKDVLSKGKDVPFSVRQCKCPFYGFVRVRECLVDNEGNGCGLVGGNRPCLMETTFRETPNWSKCGLGNGRREKIEQSLAQYSIFPNELWPKGRSSWDGINLLEWYRRSLEKNPAG
jgi:hypothetical protein